MIATGSISRIRKPTMPSSAEPILKMRAANDTSDTITMTGSTPLTPPLTTLLPALVLANRPSVMEPNSAGSR